MARDPLDPKGLIRESYRIENIGAGECRSIFLDWALSVPVGEDPKEHVRRLLGKYAKNNPGHPMTETLQAALDEIAAPRRRGGRARRLSQTS